MHSVYAVPGFKDVGAVEDWGSFMVDFAADPEETCRIAGNASHGSVHAQGHYCQLRSGSAAVCEPDGRIVGYHKVLDGVA